MKKELLKEIGAAIWTLEWVGELVTPENLAADSKINIETIREWWKETNYVPRKPRRKAMKNIYRFVYKTSNRECFGLTLDETGSNLPAIDGKWKRAGKFDIVENTQWLDFPHPNYIIEDIDNDGYFYHEKEISDHSQFFDWRIKNESVYEKINKRIDSSAVYERLNNRNESSAKEIMNKKTIDELKKTVDKIIDDVEKELHIRIALNIRRELININQPDKYDKDITLPLPEKLDFLIPKRRRPKS